MNGDVACAEGAIAAGCRFFAGYPITPATEVAEHMAVRLPYLGGMHIQMEDEIASMAAILGASWAGQKAMTSTSGPGFSLMMENLGLGIVTETPCVVVNVQRAGPSTGLPTLVAQGDMMQARWGSHGHYEIIALVPSSPQEAFDYTIRAFNLSEKYRVPVLLMTDEVVGHMMEKVTIPPKSAIRLVSRRKPRGAKARHQPFSADASHIPPMATAGDGYFMHITGLTHDSRGYPGMDAPTQKEMVERLVAKIRTHAEEIMDVEEYLLEDARVVLVSYGVSVRSSLKAMFEARDRGMKVGLLKLNTVWPFPERRVRELATTMDALITVEINLGQIALEVERSAAGRAATDLVGHAGGTIIEPGAILEAIEARCLNV